jgi:hypothetical protein
MLSEYRRVHFAQSSMSCGDQGGLVLSVLPRNDRSIVKLSVLKKSDGLEKDWVQWASTAFAVSLTVEQSLLK